MNYNYMETKGRITAVLPRYTETGNVVYVYYDNGTYEVSENRLRYILDKYFHHWSYTYESLSQSRYNKTCESLGPLAVTHKHTLVPLKVRAAKFAGDSVYGYFCHEKITYPEDTSRDMAPCLVCQNIEFEVLATFETIQKKRKAAEQAQLHWQKQNGYLEEEMLMRKQALETMVVFNKLSDQVQKLEMSKGNSD